MATRYWPGRVIAATRAALTPLADPQRARGAFAYMKGIAPFLGISAPDRRRALKFAWRDLPSPTSDELGEAALALMALREREFHYAAYDLLQRHIGVADETFLVTYVQDQLTTKPWWDTVDGLGTAAVVPLCTSFDERDVIDTWSESGDRWLIRAAIGHQRGRKGDTDVPGLLRLCDRHWGDREFFVAKAIGWALRDLTAIDPAAVERFVATHSANNRVAVREAQRGLDRIAP